MATKSTVPVEDYLRMTFDGPEPEYLDGELLERHLGEDPHSAAQTNLTGILYNLKARLGIHPRTEMHLRITPNRYRIADIAVFLERPTERIPCTPPLITIEIISREDRHKDIRDKCEEYRAWGVKHVWLVDPARRSLSVFDEQGLHDVRVFHVPEFDIDILPEQIFD
jgi:Uma2 family endonuclease